MQQYSSIFLITALSVLISIMPVSAQGNECTNVWEDAQAVIADQCNDSISPNFMCYANQPLATEPEFAGFKNKGDQRKIDEKLKSIIANPDGTADNQVGGFSFLKIITGNKIEGITFGQPVILIAFGNTNLLQILNLEKPITIDDLNQGNICQAELIPDSTTFGGSYIRVLPDPRFQIECVTPNCQDKDNQLHFVWEGEEFEVKGTNANRDTILVQNRFATGWISANPQYIRLLGCDLADLPVFDDNIILDTLRQETQLPIASKFQLENRETSESPHCRSERRPPGGLLILNSSHQRVVFSINSIEITMSSSVFIWEEDYSTKIFVLQGEVAISNSVAQDINVTSGRVFEVPSVQDRPRPISEGFQWCEALSNLARAVYQTTKARDGGPQLNVPQERIDYCAFIERIR